MTEPKRDRLRIDLGGIRTPAMNGDNLAITLASYFEDFADEDGEMDESGTWKQSAIDAMDEVLDAVHAHYTAPVEGMTDRVKASWLDALGGLIAKFDAGAHFGERTEFNREGSAAMRDLLKGIVEYFTKAADMIEASNSALAAERGRNERLLRDIAQGGTDG